ncbi:aminoglycoside N(3)-acetyltransferase [Acrocarpospora catenulata]|uniref:aminoglycoside N(3)-acetyltransferase n=1 Tax=Acrocarpospora catenulata TaxID=2836182 RepID=UPI0027E2026F|nr:AAC(3) family N-acetyltransferase [Acrocarpospora catenulata]
MTPSDTEVVHTRATLARDLRRIGLPRGGIVLVHSSLSEVGTVAGGPAAVIAAVRDVLGPEGTLVAPTFTEHNSLSSNAYLEAVQGMTPAEKMWYHAQMPPFDRETMPSRGMGQIPEQLRMTPGAIRSDHPQTSFAALGPAAATLMDGHDRKCHLGELSPLGAMYRTGAHILLLGAGYDSCSAFHLAEYRQPEPPEAVYRCVVKTPDGRREWCEYMDIVLDDTDFACIGEALDRTGIVNRGEVGSAPTRLAPMGPAVDFATRWLAENRRGTG